MKSSSVEGSALEARAQPKTKQPPVDQQRFSAFISYSHQDTRPVRKLHRQLESYRLPKHLGAIAAINQHGRALRPIFRDRDDLSASASLSDAITQALDAAQVLIVACSPSAKGSHWVAQEIAYFRSNHPDRTILAAIIDGSPEEAIPDALSENGGEPLAADLRAASVGGDGWGLGFLKVVAGVARVPLDTLVQRDSQRRMRRVMAVTGMFAIVALAMGVMTTIAIQARNEAQFERDEAEGLIEFMLTDLREDLEGVGRLDILDSTSSKALDYYKKQDGLAEMQASSLLRRARIIENMGREQERRHNFELAAAHFDELYRTTAELLARDPTEPERILAHAWSINRVATFRYEDDDWRSISANYSEAIALLETIRKWGASDTRWWKSFSIANANQCALGIRNGEAMNMIEGFCLESVRSAHTITELTGTDDAHYNLAYNLFWLSAFADLNGDSAASASRLNEALDINARLLANEPENAKYLNQRMEILGASREADLAETRQSLAEAILIAEKLMEKSPEDAEYKARLEKYKSRLGELK